MRGVLALLTAVLLAGCASAARRPLPGRPPPWPARPWRPSSVSAAAAGGGPISVSATGRAPGPASS